MPSIEQVFAWLLGLPPGALYATAFGLAFIENIFPPTPSDVLIGLCAFVAAAGGTPTSSIFGVVMAGTLLGAAFTYALGRKYGAQGLHARMEARGWVGREKRIELAYIRYGLVALFVGRLIMGVRSIVPMVAGAFRVHPALAMAVMGIASAVWYGIIVWMASRVGENWEVYTEQLVAFTRWGTGVAGGLVLIGAIVLGVWLYRRRKRARRDAA